MTSRRPSLEKAVASKRSSVVDALETKSRPSTLNIKRNSIADSQPLIQVETFLSRKAFPLGKTLVGSVLVRHPPKPNDDDKTPPPPLRRTLRSIVVYAAGYCKIDPRWHNAKEYATIYGSVHPFIQQVDFDSKLLYHGAGKDTVCFWATNGLDLMTLPERKLGKFQTSESDNDERLAFTYRIDLPMDLPHSINATTCKYYYVVNILIKTQTKQKVIHSPFVVLTSPEKPLPRSKQEKNARTIVSGRVKFGDCSGIAHSIGLPCHLSSTEINRPKGQMTVAMASRRPDVQTLKIDSTSGKPVCVLTFVGATKVTPGSRIHLQWDFPEQMTPDWTPCFQVSACLLGEELAVYEDGKTKRTQTHIFDTCHEYVEPGVTQRVSKTLLVSVDAPCNLLTDVMSLSVRCQVDITVQEAKSNGKYSNLKIELPCHVMHHLEKDSTFEHDETKVAPLSQMLREKPDKIFPTHDIVSDLKVLSLEMEKRLRTTKRGLS
eukprot:scaffold1669_cov129-Cylindrotheca_fusiformis.AAC.20